MTHGSGSCFLIGKGVLIRYCGQDASVTDGITAVGPGAVIHYRPVKK